MTRWYLDRTPHAGVPAHNLRHVHSTIDREVPAGAFEGESSTWRAPSSGSPDTGMWSDATESMVAGVVPIVDRTEDRSLPIVGIAGATGKAMAGAFLRAIRRAEGLIVGSVTPGAWFDGDSVRPAGHDPLAGGTLGSIVAEMTRHRCDSAVVEVDEGAIRRRDVDSVPLAAVVVTSLGDSDDHDLASTTDRHETRRLFARLIRRVEAGGAVIIDGDDSEADVLGAVNLAARRVTFRVNPTPVDAPHTDVAATIERLDGESCRFLLSGFDRDAIITLRVGGGPATVRAALAAATVAWSQGVGIDAVIRGLESVGRIPGRFEAIHAGQPFQVRVDKARTPAALARSLADLRSITAGRVVCVVGDSGEDAAEAAAPRSTRLARLRRRAQLGRVAEVGSDLVVLTANDPRDEDANVIADDLRAGMNRPGRARIELDRGAAIAFALAEAQPDDGVLITGKGTVGTQTIGPATVPFDDAAEAARLLRARQRATQRISA